MKKKYRYPAVKIHQSGTAKPLVLLAANAIEINQWAGVPQKLRVVVNDDVSTELLGFQRDEDPDRINQIAQFYADANNVLQNPLLCAIRKPLDTEVTFIEDPASVNKNVSTGHLEIQVNEGPRLQLVDLFKEVRGFLEERIPSLAGNSPSEKLVTRLRNMLNGNDAEETESEEVEESEVAPLEEALTEQSHIGEFWDAIAAREQLLNELGRTPDEDEFLGFSRQVLEAYLCPVILVDGQHRLMGAIKAADTALEQKNNAIDRIAELHDQHPNLNADQIQLQLKIEHARTLPISLLLDERPEEHVFQFVIVNQKATPVRAALLGTIISTSLGENELDTISNRLEDAGVPLQSSMAITYFAKNENSPFSGLVARGLLGDGTEKLPWSVLGQLVTLFRDLRGAKYFHDPKIDYADIWKRRLLDSSGIINDWNVHDAATAYEYWKQNDGPWRDVFNKFWANVRDILGDTTSKSAPNYWGQPRSSNLFNKPSLLTLATDFFAYLVESKQTIESIDAISDLVADWLADIKKDYFARDWKLSGVKKDSTGIRRQWSYLWFSYRRDPKGLPQVSAYSRIYKNS